MLSVRSSCKKEQSMEVIIVKDYEAVSDRAAQVAIAALKRKPNLVLGLATGGTPVGLYRRLIQAHKNDRLDLSKAVTFNLDEYVGLGPDHPQSYRRFMGEQLFDHVNVNPANVHIPDGLAKNLTKHCAQYEKMIARAGGVDVQVLGIGRDGHIGFNEPGTSLGSLTHVTALTRETIQDNARFFETAEEVPHFAITMGIATILRARKCLLLVSGAAKAGVLAATVEGPVTSMVTASALQMHPDTVAIVDEPAASKLSLADFYRWQEQNWPSIADRL
jgi:glucosamine-6-phosphate deaminase